MTVQPADIEPDENRARPSTGAAWLRNPKFRAPERAPWSQLNFTETWGFQLPQGEREHLEVFGPSGSGKTYLVQTILQDHYRMAEARREASKRKHIETGAVFAATKKDDRIFSELGWPIVHDVSEIRDTNVIFWPQTSKKGEERHEYHRRKMTALLDHLFTEKANTLLGFDEVGYVEQLGNDVRKRVQDFWREGRSLGAQVIGMKQRPQGALRDMHSETFWTVSFRPNDDGDLERWAELFGARRDWMPVFRQLNPARHEFLIRHSKDDQAFISWVDTPLKPQKIRRKGLVALVSR